MNFPESLEQHRQTFLEALKIRHYSPATIKSRNGSLNQFFCYLASGLIDDVREVTRQTIRNYQAALMRDHSINTVHVHLAGVRRFFEHLEKTDVILVNPCAGLLLPKLQDRLPRTILTPAEARLVLDAPDTQTFQGIRDKAILEVFYSTGIRLEEMERLTVYDVDHRNGFVRVTKGKGAKDRVAPMGGKACEYVREYLQKVRAEWSKTNRDERALWLSARKPHAPLKKQMIAVMVRESGQTAGLSKRVTPHVWRHTCAAHLVSQGSNIAYVQRLLGHRSLKTTQRYTKVSASEIQQTFRRSHPRRNKPAEAEPAPATKRRYFRPS